MDNYMRPQGRKMNEKRKQIAAENRDREALELRLLETLKTKPQPRRRGLERKRNIERTAKTTGEELLMKAGGLIFAGVALSYIVPKLLSRKAKKRKSRRS